MDWLKHAGETRRAIEHLSEDGKKDYARLRRADVLKLLEPLAGKVERQLSEEAKTACKEKGISAEWNLADNDDAVVFCVTALASDLTEHEKAAVNLLRGCIQIEETGIAPSWFFDAMAGIDLDRKHGKNWRAEQAEKASKLRGKIGDDGETNGQIIGELALMREHRNLKSRELWNHYFSALEDRGLDPEEEDESNPDWHKWIIWYDFKDERKPITGGQFANVVSDYKTGKKSG